MEPRGPAPTTRTQFACDAVVGASVIASDSGNTASAGHCSRLMATVGERLQRARAIPRRADSLQHREQDLFADRLPAIGQTLVRAVRASRTVAHGPDMRTW